MITFASMNPLAIMGGTGVALVTPMLASGDIDFDGLDALLAHTRDHVDYYVVMGTTGENATLTSEENDTVLQYVLQNKQDGMPLIYGLGGNNTSSVIRQSREILMDIDAILSVCPYYNKPTQVGLIQHFSAIANASPVPVILYNVPARTGVNLNADSTVFLAKHDKIIGIKEASGNLEQCMEIMADKPNAFELISGDDLLTVPMIGFGACGVISVLANAIPSYFATMVRQAIQGDYPTANAMMLDLLPLNRLMYAEGNPAGVKAALSCLGVCQPHTRLPLAQASSELGDAIALSLTQLRRRWPGLVD